MEIHDLTEKEIKAINNAVSTIKNFATYIKRVNGDNYWLKKNLDESIKAGDVTNAQKVALRCFGDSERIYEEILAEILKECHGGPCPKHHNPEVDCPSVCELKQKSEVLSWMRGAFHGDKQQWNWILDYALEGRKMWCNRYHGTDFRVEA